MGQTEGWTTDLPLVEPGVAIEFPDATLTVRDIIEGGDDYDSVALSAVHETGSISGIYGVTVTDADVVTVATSTDVPDALAAFCPGQQAGSEQGFHPASYKRK